MTVSGLTIKSSLGIGKLSAIKLLMSRQSQNNFKYSYDIPEEEMKALFTEKLREKSV